MSVLLLFRIHFDRHFIGDVGAVKMMASSCKKFIQDDYNDAGSWFTEENISRR